MHYDIDELFSAEEIEELREYFDPDELCNDIDDLHDDIDDIDLMGYWDE